MSAFEISAFPYIDRPRRVEKNEVVAVAEVAINVVNVVVVGVVLPLQQLLAAAVAVAVDQHHNIRPSTFAMGMSTTTQSRYRH
jgi:hypothetical protein